MEDLGSLFGPATDDPDPDDPSVRGPVGKQTLWQMRSDLYADICIYVYGRSRFLVFGQCSNDSAVFHLHCFPASRHLSAGIHSFLAPDGCAPFQVSFEETRFPHIAKEKTSFSQIHFGTYSLLKDSIRPFPQGQWRPLPGPKGTPDAGDREPLQFHTHHEGVWTFGSLRSVQFGCICNFIYFFGTLCVYFLSILVLD